MRNLKISFIILLFLHCNDFLFCQYIDPDKARENSSAWKVRVMYEFGSEIPFVHRVFNFEDKIFSIAQKEYKSPTNFYIRYLGLDFKHGYNNLRWGFNLLFENYKSKVDFLLGAAISKNVFKMDSISTTFYVKYNSFSPSIMIKYTTRPAHKAHGITTLISGGTNLNFGFKKRDNTEEHKVYDNDNSNINKYNYFGSLGLFYEFAPGAVNESNTYDYSTSYMESTGKTLMLLGISYEKNFSDVFNKAYKNKNAIKPYSSLNSKFGLLSIKLIMVIGSSFSYERYY